MVQKKVGGAPSCTMLACMYAACLMMAANSSPTGCPRRERSRLPPRKRLFSEPQPMPASAPEVWGDEENKGLIEFVLFHCDPAVWNDAATFVEQRSKASVKRTGSDLRFSLINYYNFT